MTMLTRKLKPCGTTAALGCPQLTPLCPALVVWRAEGRGWATNLPCPVPRRRAACRDCLAPPSCLPGAAFPCRAPGVPACPALLVLGLRVGVRPGTPRADGCDSSTSQTSPRRLLPAWRPSSWAPDRLVGELQELKLPIISTQTPQFILATSEAFPAAGSSVLPSSAALAVPGYCREPGPSERACPQRNRL